jgi:dipeptidyl aminopeptidase/acylaminoacyl peptidase
MKPIGWIAASAALVCASAGAAPLDVYGRLPAIDSVVISPDGADLALLVTNGDQRRIVIEDVASRKIVAAINAGTQKVRDLRWAGNHHLLITASQTGLINDVLSRRNENFLATDFDIAKHNQRPLLRFFTSQSDNNLNIILGYPETRMIDGRPYAFVAGIHFLGTTGRATLFNVDLDSGGTTNVSDGFPTTQGYAVGADGALLAETDYDAPSKRWSLKAWTGHWTEIGRQQTGIEVPSLLGLGRADGALLVGYQGDSDYTIHEVPLDGRKWGDALTDADPERLVFDPVTHRLIGTAVLIGDTERYTFYDPNDQKIWNALVAAYPASKVTLASMSDDHRKWVLRVDSPTEGPAYALVDLATKKGSWIGDVYAGLKPGDVSPVRPVAFTAKDGLALTGYLTLPYGKTAKALPLVVLPHGGPAARDFAGFDWWAQALASRGYAVLQVNYRGSDGFGWAFQSAGFGQWGRKMQTDLSDGVRYLAKQGVIDPARVCIVGGSYGGYAALAGATLDPGVYRCAVSVAGVSDPARLVDWDATREGRQGVQTQRYWVRYMGATSTMGDISPARHADAATAPILLIHGKDDTVVPYSQSEEMASALRAAGKPVEFVTLKGEDHWLSEGETRLQMLQATAAFLEKNNPPD